MWSDINGWRLTWNITIYLFILPQRSHKWHYIRGGNCPRKLEAVFISMANRHFFWQCGYLYTYNMLFEIVTKFSWLGTHMYICTHNLFFCSRWLWLFTKHTTCNKCLWHWSWNMLSNVSPVQNRTCLTSVILNCCGTFYIVHNCCNYEELALAELHIAHTLLFKFN